MATGGKSSASQFSQSQDICAWLNRFEKDVELPTCDDVDDLITNELDRTERNETPKASLAHSDRYSKKFQAFLCSHGCSDDVALMSNNRLNLSLRFFYHNLRADNGDLLSPSTLSCVRAGLNRYLTSPPINRVVDIVKGVEFVSANRMLKIVGNMYLKAGGKVTQYKAIHSGDLEKIFAHFDRSSPLVLQEELVFNTLYYFGQRGREGLRQLTRNSFEFRRNSDAHSHAAFLSISLIVLLLLI